MLFNVEADTGDEIVGYLVPDSYAETPRLCVIGAGRLLWSGPASETRAALVAAGRHGTGLCGFRIGPAQVPGLAREPNLELRDLASGLTIYRRPPPRALCPRRVFRLETGLVPLHRFDHAMEPHFQGWFPAVERHGAETVDQIFLLAGVGSVYASGRVQAAAHPGLAEGGVSVLARLRDPHEDLAERLSVLAGLRGPVARLLPARDRLTFRAAIGALDGLDPREPRALRRLLRRADPELAGALSNPLARQLTARAPGDPCSHGAVSAALRTLSGFDVVVPAEASGLFEAAVAGLLGVPAAEPVADPRGAETLAIAATLTEIGLVDAMLEADLEIYASVSALLGRLAGGSVQG